MEEEDIGDMAADANSVSSSASYTNFLKRLFSCGGRQPQQTPPSQQQSPTVLPKGHPQPPLPLQQWPGPKKRSNRRKRRGGGSSSAVGNSSSDDDGPGSSNTLPRVHKSHKSSPNLTPADHLRDAFASTLLPGKLPGAVEKCGNDRACRQDHDDFENCQVDLHLTSLSERWASNLNLPIECSLHIDRYYLSVPEIR